MIYAGIALIAAAIARCDAPLRAPLSDTPCVFYRATVTAQIEERRTETDSDGHRTTRWEREDRVVSDDERRTTFELCAADGAVAVSGEGAKFDRLVQTVERFEPDHGGASGAISIGGLTFGADQRILGYRHVEHVLPLGAQIFVHGSADDALGRLTFRSDAGRSLLVSTRLEEQRVAGAEQAAAWQRIGAVCGAVGGVALTVAALAGV